jgi:hypothetical protein
MMIDWRDFPIGKATYRGGTGSRLHMIQNLSRAEAKHFLLHDRYGRQLRRDFPDIPFDQLAGHLVEASKRPIEKREVPTMDSELKTILKSEAAMTALCKHIAKTGGVGFTHPQFDDFLGRYAKNRHPTLHVGNAISKVLSEEREVARAYEAVHAFYKAQPVVNDDEDDDDEDERDGDDTDALDELNELGEQERRRNPKLTKQQAFAKAYADNPALAAKERRQHRPRA